jgi:hypothetical protein
LASTSLYTIYTDITNSILMDKTIQLRLHSFSIDYTKQVHVRVHGTTYGMVVVSCDRRRYTCIVQLYVSRLVGLESLRLLRIRVNNRMRLAVWLYTRLLA